MEGGVTYMPLRRSHLCQGWSVALACSRATSGLESPLRRRLLTRGCCTWPGHEPSTGAPGVTDRPGHEPSTGAPGLTDRPGHEPSTGAPGVTDRPGHKAF